MSLKLEKNQLETLLECKGNNIDLHKYISELESLKAKIENDPNFRAFLKFNKALADKNRLLILQLLIEKEEMCICEFSISLHLTQPTITHHLKKLEDIDIIKGTKSGKFIKYKINKEKFSEYIKLFKKYL